MENDRPAGTNGTERVWAATQRRGLNYHARHTERWGQASCGRSVMAGGVTLYLDEARAAGLRPCPYCYQPSEALLSDGTPIDVH